MASYSQEELKTIFEEHKLWLDSEKKEGTRANLWKANLKKADLRRANLKGANLREAHLEKADLERAHLEKANLMRANLKGANLREAHLEKADLFETHLEKAIFIEANLEGVNLAEARLEEANLIRANLKGADLRRAHLEKANLWQTNLEGANLGGAHLKGANLGEANLEGANLRSANLEGARLGGANLENSDVTAVQFNRWAPYRGIRVATCYGSALFKRFTQDQDFIEEFRSVWWRKPIYFLWLIFADCGRSFLLWACWSIAIAIGFAFVFYSHLGEEAFHLQYISTTEGINLESLPWCFWTMLYYSVVTFTTLGFGDVTPKTLAATRWIMAEVVVGYIMLGGLISILAMKLARRS